MQVGAVVMPYRHLNGHPGRRLISARLRLAAKLRIGMDPSFERPIGDPARKRTFRLYEVSEKLAGILSKGSRHVLLPSPYDRCSDAPRHRRPRVMLRLKRRVIPHVSAARTRLAEPEHASAASRWLSMVND